MLITVTLFGCNYPLAITVNSSCCVENQLIAAKLRIFATVNWAAIGSDKGLSFVLRQAIIRTSAGVLLFRPVRKHSMKFESNSNNFHKRYTFENVVCKMPAISSRPRGANVSWCMLIISPDLADTINGDLSLWITQAERRRRVYIHTFLYSSNNRLKRYHSLYMLTISWTRRIHLH